MGNPPILLATGFPNEVNGMPTIDRSAGNGDLIGDPTEGALVALAAKGGTDAATTRRAYPRIAEPPFEPTHYAPAPPRPPAGFGPVARDGIPLMEFTGFS